jgi:hypothetical protein
METRKISFEMQEYMNDDMMHGRNSILKIWNVTGLTPLR